MKRIISILTVVAVVVFAGYNVHKAQQREVLSDVAMANVEALAQTESSMLIACDYSDLFVMCKRTCIRCGILYISVDGYGYSKYLQGKCECGASY